MDPKLLRHYRSARQSAPVFLRDDLPQPREPRPDWILIIAAVLAGLGLVTFAVAVVIHAI